MYDITATTAGARAYYNPIRTGSIATDGRVTDRATSAALAFPEVDGETARAGGVTIAPPGSKYIAVTLARPAPEGGGGRIRIDKTYEDAKSYYTDGDAIVFDRTLGIKRNAVVLPAGYRLASVNVPAQVLQQADGRFSARVDPFLARLLSVPVTNPQSAGNEGFNLLLDLHLADLNGDKFADLIAGFGHGSTPSLLFINKNGQFNFDERQALPASTYGIDTNLHLETQSADFDNDGDLDLLIQHTRYVPYYGGNYLQLLRNDNGSFTDITATALSQVESEIKGERLSWSPNVFVRDLDGDRLVDIVYGINNGRLLVFFNQGGGRFTRMTTTLPRGENGVLLTVADFDADGKQDLLYYQYGGSETEKLYFINVYRLDFKKP